MAQIRFVGSERSLRRIYSKLDSICDDRSVALSVSKSERRRLFIRSPLQCGEFTGSKAAQCSACRIAISPDLDDCIVLLKKIHEPIPGLKSLETRIGGRIRMRQQSRKPGSARFL